MDNKVDLHIHTTASDGRMAPGELLAHAKAEGLTYIALTDHDSVDGLLMLETTDLAPYKDMTIIPGIEFSTDFPQNEVHILGYGLDIHATALTAKLAKITAARQQREKKMIGKLQRLGYDVCYEEVLKAASGTTALGRPHIARVLVDKGYYASVTEAFKKLLHKQGSVYLPHYKLSAQEAIALIIDSGGLPVLAHPGLINNDDIVRELIAAGIRGIEVYHPSHDETAERRYSLLAAQHALIVTGGSDFHAVQGRYPEKLGVFLVPAAILPGILSVMPRFLC